MKRSHAITVLTLSILLLGPITAVGAPNPQNVIFSLDDLPVAPINPPPYAPPVPVRGWGAEDPFGVGVFLPGPLAPSPSLVAVAPIYSPVWDSTILQTGTISGSMIPDVHLAPVILFSQFPHASINAMSGFVPDRSPEISLYFSVDRVSIGMPQTAVSNQAVLNQQPGDIFEALGNYPSPIQFTGALPPGAGYVPNALPTAGTGLGGNTLTIDESQLTLTAGAGPGVMTPANVLAPPITQGSHDNLDAMDFRPLDYNGDGMIDAPGVFPMLFSVNPDDAAALGALTSTMVSAADIFTATPLGNISTIAIPATSSGLDAFGVNTDDIDALHMITDGAGGGGALFSLAPGSASLVIHNLSAADIFFTDFNGSFSIYLTAGDIGLLPSDNVDALPEPATMSLLALGCLVLLPKRRRLR